MVLVLPTTTTYYYYYYCYCDFLLELLLLLILLLLWLRGFATKLYPAKGESLAEVQLKIGESSPCHI